MSVFRIAPHKSADGSLLFTSHEDHSVAPTILGMADVQIDGDIVTISNDKFRLSDVMLASVNRNTSSDDGIGGSAVFKTREFEPSQGAVQKIYKGTFDGETIVMVAALGEWIEASGGTFRTHYLKDFAFRKTFF